jgi:2-polyprenyl-3-methyl-5-hydroxy-6-metoxy-1,4-benzoquinol methylase
MRNPFKIHEFFEVTRGVRLDAEDIILDLGCGKGMQTQVLARQCRRAVGLDISAKQISAARELQGVDKLGQKLEFNCGPIEGARFADESFDHVFSFCVLEHITNLAVVLERIHGLLKPHGELHVSVDSLGNIRDPALIAKHRQDHLVHRYFTAQTLRAELQAAGFSVERVFPIFHTKASIDSFQRRIEQGNYSFPIPVNIVKYVLLAAYERANDDVDDRGVFLVAHARRT